MRYRMGIDIGGTFTDVVLEDLRQGTMQFGKLLTTPEDPAAAVIDAIKQILAKAGAAAADVLVVIHGTTLATNAVIERKGATIGLLTTDGFIDVLAIGRESRYDHYDLQLEPPEPLVPRSRRCGVVERIDRDGAVVRSIDLRQLSAQVDTLRKAGVASIAVCYLHSFKNPAHERATADHIATVAPDILVSCSSDVSPELREYERTSTTVINAYLQPVVERYLERLENELKQLGIGGTLHLMLSSGLLTTAAQARRFPTRLIESGPAGGVKLATHYAELTGQKNLIAFDMGGTTAKASVIHEGEVPVAREFEVARVERFKRGSGFPVRVPCVEIVEIGTGGGSIAWIDELGQLQVGPGSAGSVPGAACYDRGGTNATVTDADLVLGYLDPNYFLGGEMRLDVDAAVQAIESKVAMPLGIPVAQAAWGIHRVANEEMASAFRIHAMEQGRDPSRYGLLCFGGAGPVHAFGVAHILRSPSIISPASAGVASALGFLVAPVAAETVRSYVARLDRIDWDYLNTILDELADEGRGLLLEAGIEDQAISVVRSADMQYVGQMHDIAVNVPSGRLGPADEDGLRQAFYVRYRELFQRVVTRVPVEVLTWRVTVSAPAPEIDLRWRPTAPAVNARKGERPAYFPERGFLTTPIFDRYALRPGDILRGPAIVEERESTLVVGSDAQVRMDSYGSLVVNMPANQSAEAATVSVGAPLITQVLWARLRALMNEAGATLRRTAFSFPTRESNDFAAVLMDVDGDSIAQSVQSIPSFMATLPLTTKAVLQKRTQNAWRPGDVVLTNDPWIGAGHLPDVSIVQPIFWHDQLVGFAGSITHVSDVGGKLFGGQTEEIYEEGLRFLPTLIQTADGLNETFFDVIRSNTRVPDEVIGDIHALIAANDSTIRGVGQLLDEGELRDLTQFGRLIMDRSEAAMRAAIAKVPAGMYHHTVYADGYDEPIKLQCTLHVKGEEIVIDYEGSSPQVPFPLNGVHNFTFAYSVYPLKCAIGPDIPNNSGTLRPFTVIAPVGSVLNCRYPAPVGLRHINGQLLQAALFGALSSVLPRQVIAESGSPAAIAVISGLTGAKEGFVVYLYLSGGMGARATKDGLSTTNFPSTITNVPCEVAEQAAPIRIERKEYRVGSAGLGRYRGGFGQEIHVRNLSPFPMTISMLTDRHKYPPLGLEGAKSGATGAVSLESGKPIKAKGHSVVEPGDCVIIQTPGGGGYGPATERSPELIERDRADGLGR